MDWIDIAFKTIATGFIGYLILRLTRHLDEQSASIKLAHERHMVTDRVVSHLTEFDYDSSVIAKGLQPFPRMKKPLREN